jgi:hypothetical protein
MNSEERRLLTEFLDQLKTAQGVTKDPEADGLIARAVATQPDAPYLLVQKALLQERALANAKARIAQLEQAQSRPREAHRGGFLGGDPWGSPAAPAFTPGAGSPWAAAPQPSPSPWGGFLGTAAATAAGVAGGAFLFHGIESLLDHHGPGDGGFFDAADSRPDPIENLTVNEYFVSDDAARDEGFLDADFDASNSRFDDYDEDDDGSLNV